MTGVELLARLRVPVVTASMPLGAGGHAGHRGVTTAMPSRPSTDRVGAPP